MMMEERWHQKILRLERGKERLNRRAMRREDRLSRMVWQRAQTRFERDRQRISKLLARWSHARAREDRMRQRAACTAEMDRRRALRKRMRIDMTMSEIFAEC